MTLDHASLAKLSRAERAPLLSAHLYGLSRDASNKWIDAIYPLAEKLHAEGDPMADRVFDTYYLAGDIHCELQKGTDAKAIRYSPFRGIVSDFGPDDEMQTIPANRRPASADFPDGIDAGMESLRENAADAFYAGDVTLVSGADIRPEAIEWLWHGFFAAGKFHVIPGAPGTGKTTIAVNVAAILTTGGFWPDGTRAPLCNVAIWSAEDDAADTLVPRLLAAGADLTRILFVTSTREADGESRPFDPATDLRHLERALAGRDVKLLIVDPVVSAVAGDSHKNTETRRALQPLVDLGKNLGCAIVGITHFSKGTAGRDPVERVTGSIAFGALARVVFAAAKATDDDVDADGCDRLFVRSKSNIGPDGGGFRYALEQVAVPGHSHLFASRVRWGSALEGEARDLLATAEAASDPEEKSALADAVNFLRDLLADGPKRARDVFNDAHGAGHSQRSIQRAADKLNVDRRKEGMKEGWTWRLPLVVAPKMP